MSYQQGFHMVFFHSFIAQHYKKTEHLRRAYCGGCKNRRYRSPIAAHFWPAAVHEIYCGGLYARRNSSSILRRTIAAGQLPAAIDLF